MRKKLKQPLSYFRLDAKLAQKLDKRIARAGFTSRSEYFTAVAHLTLYGVKTENKPQTTKENETTANIPETVTEWVKNTLPRISEEEIQTGLHAVIAEMLTPVIAMKGFERAFQNTWHDVRQAYHERCGIWITESDAWEAYESFAAVHKAELLAYREQQLQKSDAEVY